MILRKKEIETKILPAFSIRQVRNPNLNSPEQAIASHQEKDLITYRSTFDKHTCYHWSASFFQRETKADLIKLAGGDAEFDTRGLAN